MKPTTILSSFCVAAIVFASLASYGQVKIGTNPTTIDPASNLEIEATSTDRKASFNKTSGQFTLKDGTEANGRILTSDANGGSSWQSAPSLRIPETVWIGEQVGTYGVTPFTGTFDELKDRIPLTARAGSLPGYNTSTKQYTIQESGYYRIHIGARIQGTTGNTTLNFVRLYLSNFGVLQQFDNFNNAQGPVLSLFWEGYMLAGTTFDPYVISETNGGVPQVANVSKCFLSVTKLF